MYFMQQFESGYSKLVTKMASRGKRVSLSRFLSWDEEVIRNYGYKEEYDPVEQRSTDEQLRSTGIVWEETDNFQNISQDNKQATLLVLQHTLELVKDAFREIEEAVEAEGGGLSQLLDIDDIDDLNNEDSWSEGDKNFINTSLGLMKTIKSLLKKTKEALKTNGSCCTEQNISQMDDLADFLKRLSPVVDDMTIVLYPPIVSSSVTSKVNSLAGNLSDILNFLKSSHMTTAEDEKWIDFLCRAKQHNVDKIFEALNDVS